MSRKVVVTGLGVVSALGLGLKRNIEVLQSGDTGIAPIRYLQTRLKDKFVLGELKYSNSDLKSMLHLPEDELISRTTLMGLLAVKEAIGMADLSVEELKTCAFISGTTVGGMDLTEQIVDFDSEKDLHKTLSLHPCGDSSEKIASTFGMNGFISTYSTACSSAANAIMMGARLIKSGRADRVIAGGTDALSCFTLNGFNSLMILDNEYCRPFDKSRAGLNLGEGAGYIVLEADDLAKPNKALAILSGYANANDAHHQTASSPEGIGAGLSMKRAMDVAGLKPADISYVNAHGTGTPNNDSSESNAIANLFGENHPPFSSTKSFTGHTLGACGGIESVFSVMALQNQELYAGLNFSEADEASNMIPIDQYKKAEINHVLSNSFGFGGNNSSLIFSKI